MHLLQVKCKVVSLNLAHPVYEIYNTLYSREWVESEARAVARWRGLGRNGREVECFSLHLNVLMVGAFLTV